MGAKFSFGNIELGVGTQPAEAAEASGSGPFRIAILGDFSGRANRGICETGVKLASRRAIMVDRDNLDAVLAKLGVHVHLPLEGMTNSALEIKFSELDDFLPDRMFERLELFQTLRRARKRLNNTSTFAAAAAEVRAWAWAQKTPAPAAAQKTPASATPAPPAVDPSAPAGVAMPEGLFDQMLETQEAQPRESLADVNWNAYIAKIVEPHIIPGNDPDQPELVRRVDEATGHQMRVLLQHPDFKAQEAAWRGVYFLIRRLETDPHLKVFLLDISKQELAADLAAANTNASGAYKLLVEQTVGTPGAPQWSVLLGNYTWDETRADAELLGQLGQIAQQAGAPLIGEGSPHLVHCESFHNAHDPDDWQRPCDAEGHAAWQAVRGSSAASYLGLTTPRILLRLPYGKDSDPMESFEFEELIGRDQHQQYLWGNGAFACVCLLGQSFTQAGWGLQPGMLQEISGLPIHVFDDDGERAVKPCGEAIIIERAAATIAQAGMMPIVTLKNQDVIRLPSFRSLSTSGGKIAGRWG